MEGTLGRVGDFAPRIAQTLEFYAVTREGTINTRELSRFMERTNPLWWSRVVDAERQEYWDRVGRTLIARYVRSSNYVGACRPAQVVTTEHEIRHGHRPRPGREDEYGFVDVLRVLRSEDDVVLADFEVHSVWMDLRDGFRLATTAPEGLEELDQDLPPVPASPSTESAQPVQTFRWTLRESDLNGHVGLLSYLERAENATCDLGLASTLPITWEAWYRAPSFAGEQMQVAVWCESDRSAVISFAEGEAARPRTIVRMSAGGEA